MAGKYSEDDMKITSQKLGNAIANAKDALDKLKKIKYDNQPFDVRMALENAINACKALLETDKTQLESAKSVVDGKIKKMQDA